MVSILQTVKKHAVFYLMSSSLLQCVEGGEDDNKNWNTAFSDIKGQEHM